MIGNAVGNLSTDRHGDGGYPSTPVLQYSTALTDASRCFATKCAQGA